MDPQPPGPTDKSSFFRNPPPRPSSSQFAPRLPAAPSPPTPPQSAPPPLPPQGASGAARHLAFHGSGGSLFGIQVVNAFLTLLTLGIFYFWAKVRIRRYVLSETELEGERFAYHGTGRELLLGYLKAVLVLGLPFGLLQILFEMTASPVIRTAIGILVYTGVMLFVPVAMVGARRYRLSRISWRGIRFSFRGRTVEFVKLFVGGSLVTTLTLGLYYPIFDTRRFGFLMANSCYGTQRLAFDGRGRDLFWSYVRTLLLSLPTVGLCWFWFLARKRRYLWDHTAVAAARFRSTVTGGALLRLTVVNALLLLVTLGLAWPWVQVRNIRFALRYLSLVGPLDLGLVRQDAQAASATGEGLAGFLDSGFDLG